MQNFANIKIHERRKMEKREGYAIDSVDKRIKAGNDGMKEHKNVTIYRDEGKKFTLRLYDINFVLSIDPAKLFRTGTLTMFTANIIRWIYSKNESS